MPDQEHQGPTSIPGVSIPEQGWGGFTGLDTGLPLAQVKQALPPDVPAHSPVAEVRLKLFGLAPGTAEVQLWVAPDGALATVRHPGPAQAAAVEQLQQLVNQELARACSLLGCEQ